VASYIRCQSSEGGWRDIAAEEHIAKGAGVVVRGLACNDGLNGGGEGFSSTDAGDALIGVDDDDAVVIRAIEQADIRVFDAKMGGLHIGDLHWAGTSPALIIERLDSVPGMVGDRSP